MVRGRFITFEGIDGAGKTTHLAWFRQRLDDKIAATGRSVVITREPGGTTLGESLRDLLLNQPMDRETEALLMFAARREHLAQIIEPALARGDWVLSDRFSDATFAYQGGGRGLPRDKLEALERWVQGGFQPDLTVLFDVPTNVASERRGAGSAGSCTTPAPARGPAADSTSTACTRSRCGPWACSPPQRSR